MRVTSGKTGKIKTVESTLSCAISSGLASGKTGAAKLVVLGPFFVIRKDRIRFVHLFKLGFITSLLVWVIFVG